MWSVLLADGNHSLPVSLWWAELVWRWRTWHGQLLCLNAPLQSLSCGARYSKEVLFLLPSCREIRIIALCKSCLPWGRSLVRFTVFNVKILFLFSCSLAILNTLPFAMGLDLIVVWRNLYIDNWKSKKHEVFFSSFLLCCQLENGKGSCFWAEPVEPELLVSGSCLVPVSNHEVFRASFISFCCWGYPSLASYFLEMCSFPSDWMKGTECQAESLGITY